MTIEIIWIRIFFSLKELTSEKIINTIFNRAVASENVVKIAKVNNIIWKILCLYREIETAIWWHIFWITATTNFVCLRIKRIQFKNVFEISQHAIENQIKVFKSPFKIILFRNKVWNFKITKDLIISMVWANVIRNKTLGKSINCSYPF